MREIYMSPTHRLIQFLNFCFFILMITSIYGENTNSLLSIKLFKALLQDVGVCCILQILGSWARKLMTNSSFSKWTLTIFTVSMNIKQLLVNTWQACHSNASHTLVKGHLGSFHLPGFLHIKDIQCSLQITVQTEINNFDVKMILTTSLSKSNPSWSSSMMSMAIIFGKHLLDADCDDEETSSNG